MMVPESEEGKRFGRADGRSPWSVRGRKGDSFEEKVAIEFPETAQRGGGRDSEKGFSFPNPGLRGRQKESCRKEDPSNTETETQGG